MLENYDALLLVSFGGPEGPDDVMPFLENVLRGKNVPRERMLEVAEHYQHFGGVSPINEQNRQLIAASSANLPSKGRRCRSIGATATGIRCCPTRCGRWPTTACERALACSPSAFSSYSGCRQYREDIARAQDEVGRKAPQIDKLRMFFNHPGFIEPQIEAVAECLSRVPEDRREQTLLLFTAHSIPLSMADNCRTSRSSKRPADWWPRARGTSDGNWSTKAAAARRISRGSSRTSATGSKSCTPPANSKTSSSCRSVSFPTTWKCSTTWTRKRKHLCDRLGITMHRAATVGTHPRFVRMIRELIVERINDCPEKPALGKLGPSHDICPDDCCLYTPSRPPSA